jgi:hypothetical protein
MLSFLSLSFARTPSARACFDFRPQPATRSSVLEFLLLTFRAIALACRGHEEVVLENIALLHQLRTLQRTVKRPRLRPRDRMFWVVLAMTWRR